LSSSRPEIAFVLLLVQAGAWLLAAMASLPFALGGEAAITLLALPTTLLATLTLLLAAGLVSRRRWARRWTLALEWTCLVGSLLLLVIPVGSPSSPVALAANVVLPAAVLCLLMGRRARAAFGA
jgi:hypothetical protein